MKPFEFHGELFGLRSTVLDALAANGFVWLSDFASVDLSHDTYGLEVTGIREQKPAMQIQQLLHGLFPNWRFHRLYYEDRNLGEMGWKVIISREPEQIAERSLWNHSQHHCLRRRLRRIEPGQLHLPLRPGSAGYRDSRLRQLLRALGQFR